MSAARAAAGARQREPALARVGRREPREDRERELVDLLGLGLRERAAVLQLDEGLGAHAVEARVEGGERDERVDLLVRGRVRVSLSLTLSLSLSLTLTLTLARTLTLTLTSVEMKLSYSRSRSAVRIASCWWPS